MFWLAGNPAAAAWEAQDPRMKFELHLSGSTGDFRRPLDPARVVAPGFLGGGRRPLGTPRVAFGFVSFDQARLRPGSYNAVPFPYGSDPFVPTDTSAPDMDFTRVRLAGGFGWILGRAAIGAAVGYDSRDHRSRHTGLPRVLRWVSPGVSLGLAARLPLSLQLGMSGRWVQSRETFTVVPQSALGEVYEVQGYVTGPPIRLATDHYRRRTTTDQWALGPELAGRLVGVEWLAYGRREGHRAEHTSQETEDPASDRWTAHATTLGAALRRRLPIGLTVEVEAGRTTLLGNAERSDLDGIIFRGEEAVAWVSGEARLVPRDARWSATLRVGTRREVRKGADFVARRRAEIDAWTPGGGAAVALTVGSHTRLQLGGSVALRSVAAQVPDPIGLESSYVALIWPDLAYAATRMAPWSLNAAGCRRIRRVELCLDGTFMRSGPSGARPVHSLAPDGKRTTWETGVAVRW
jgi:hypothetical protein